MSDEDEQTDTDFVFELPNGLHSFQVTEVQSPDRRRGDEYREGEPIEYTLDQYHRGDTEGPTWVRDRIDAKRKRYGDVAELNLLVYTNFPAYGLEYDSFSREAQGVATPFASVWLLNGNALCCIRENTALAFVEGWVVVPESPAYDEP